MSSQDLAQRVVKQMRDHDHFSEWLGIELVELQPGHAVVRLTVRKEMLNGFAFCHGGIAYSLADSALAFASNTNGKVTVSIENSIAYLVPVHEGDVLTATAKELSAGGRIAFYDVAVTNAQSATVAAFRGTVYRTSKDHFPHD